MATIHITGVRGRSAPFRADGVQSRSATYDGDTHYGLTGMLARTVAPAFRQGHDPDESRLPRCLPAPAA